MRRRRRPPRPLLAAALLALLAGCGATIREEARRAEPRLAPELAARLLDGAWSRLDEGKRIFDLRLTGRTRVLRGEGALVYEREPFRLRLDVFGPHATPVFSLAQAGDSMYVRLHEERRFLAGRVGDPAFAELADGRAFTGPEVLGALLGAYEPGALLAGPADTLAYAAGGEWIVTLLEEDRAHRLAFSAADSTLASYRQERGGRLAYRVRFSDYRTLEGRRRPLRVEIEDAAGRRTVRADVRRETFTAELPPAAYRLAGG